MIIKLLLNVWHSMLWIFAEAPTNPLFHLIKIANNIVVLNKHRSIENKR